MRCWAATLLQQPDRATLNLQLVPHEQPRRRANWSAELTAAVETALAQDQARPPAGVSWADWERVLTARRTEITRPLDDLRYLGTELAPKQVLLTVDEVLTRKPQPQHFCELRTARIVTSDGYRYLCGIGVSFLRVQLVVVLLALGGRSSLLLIADGARWIRIFFTEMLAQVPNKTNDFGLVSSASEMY